MSARFAGSRSLDDRRRRRLAKTGLEEIAAVGGPALASGAAADGSTPAVRVTHFPLRKLISPRAWKLWAVSLAVLLSGAGLLLACWAFAPRPTAWGPGVVRLLDPVHGRLPRLFASGCLLLAAQGAVLIYWVRSQSLRDFAGRYRIWLWCAGLMAVLGLSVAADLHLAWSQAVCRVWAVRFVHRDVLCWLLPLACPGVILFGRLLRDVRGCRSSTGMFVVAAVCCAALALWRLDRLPWPPTEQGAALAMMAVLMIAGWATLTAVLLHARFVIHYSAEPPARRQRVPRAARAEAKSPSKPTRKTKAAEAEAAATGAKFQFAPRRWWSEWRRRRAERRAERLTRREERQAARQRAKDEKAAARQQAQAERETAKEQARTERERLAAERQAEKERVAAERQQAEAERRATKETARQQEQAEKAARKQQPDEPKPKPEAKAAPAAAIKPPPSSASSAPSANDSADDDQPDLDDEEPLDPELLKGLSKSEKRKLRKAHREAQRNRRAA